jgi:predicted RecA/RadA family phage recombinase
MRAEFYQKGVSIDYKNASGATIAANTIVALGTTRCGVAGTDIPNNSVGSVFVEGVWIVPSTGTIALGAAVYYDASAEKATATATSNVPLGWAVAAAENDTVKIKLLG